jgi:predicted permease
MQLLLEEELRMSHYGSMMFNVTLPIVLACLFGALLHKWRAVETKSLADLSLYVLAPCLVIVALSESHTQPSILGSIAVFTIIHTIICWILATGTARIFSISTESRAALSLTTIFGNANNYGLPILLLAFGNEGFSLGAAYVVGQIILVNTLGLYVASRSKVSPKKAVLQIVKVPLIYACMIGLLLYFLKLQLPSGLASALKLLSNAYPAVVLIILGIQLRKINIQGFKRKEIWLSVILRVLLVPILSELILLALGIKGLLATILLVESSMPAAVNAIVLAEKFEADKEMVSLTVSITTLLSFITLPLLIALGH